MPKPAELANALLYYAVFLVSTTLHEAAHAWAAKRGGDLSAYRGGQVSLDPRPHIRREPFGMLVLPLLSVLLSGWPFGYASAPYDRAWAIEHPRRAAWMALAGPGANLLLVGVSLLLLRVGAAAGVFSAPQSVRFGHVAIGAAGAWSALAPAIGVFFSMNLLLASLNALPIPPLDGSAALPLVLSRAAGVRYLRFVWSSGSLGWIGIVIAWQLFPAIFQPLFLAAVNLLYPGAHYG
jgi:Zn-dependent protease